MSDTVRLETLQRANSCFAQFFERFCGAPVLGTEEEVQALLRIEQTLDSVGVLLDGRLQDTQDPSVHEELAAYHQNLLRLRHELADMQASAMACQANLSSQHQHLHAVKAWCALARDTN